MELPGFRELEYSVGTKEHKTTQNTRVEATQTRREMVGNFFFKLFLFANKVIFTILLRRLYYKMVAMTTVHHKTDNKL